MSESTKVLKSCQSCGKEFLIYPSGIKRGQGKYCSRACHAKGESGKGNPNWKPKVNCLCQSCGIEFEIFPSQASDGQGKYCSKRCADNAHRTKTFTNTCLRCHKTIRSDRKFCSVKCAGAYHSGENNSHYKGDVLRYCEICGAFFFVKPATVSYGQGRFCSRRCFTIYMSKAMDNTHSKAHGGKREDLGGQYFRSAWEANYARYLNWLVSVGNIKSWKYEARTFEFTKIKRGSKFYTPDFEIVNNDDSIEYHEIKGYNYPEGATKIKRMAKYYPAIPLFVIGRDEYNKIALDMRRFIPDWEYPQKSKRKIAADGYPTE